MTQGFSYAFVASRPKQVEILYFSSYPNNRRQEIRQKSKGIQEDQIRILKTKQIIKLFYIFFLNKEISVQPLFHTNSNYTLFHPFMRKLMFETFLTGEIET